MEIRIQFLLHFCIYISCVSCGYFTVIGPRFVQHKQNYSVVLTAISYYDDEKSIKVSLKGVETFEVFGPYRLTLGFIEKKLVFDLSTQKRIQNYSLIVEVPEENFKHTTEIFTIPKQYSVFIQTDKAVYKPGDTVNYRILVLDAEMKPFNVEKIKISILDSSGNEFSQIKEPKSAETVKFEKFTLSEDSEEENNESDELKTTERSIKKRRHDQVDKNILRNYVYKNQFKIDQETLLGTWSINVNVNDDDEIVTTQFFSVEEYILPRFKVIVDAKPYVTLEDNVVRLTVSALYTFHEFVAGTAKITAKVFDTGHPFKVQTTLTKKFYNIKFKKSFDFDIKKDLGIYNTIRAFQVDFNVEFTENLSGQKQSTNVTVVIQDHEKFSLMLKKVKKNFKPGFPFKIKALVRKADGSAESSTVTPVKLIVKYFLRPPLCISKSKIKDLLNTYETNMENFPINGVADFVLNVPENSSLISVTAEYLFAKTSMNVSKFISNTREFLMVSLRTRPKLGKKLKVLVQGNIVDRTDIYSLVVGRTGIIHHTKHEEFDDGFLKFNIKTSNDMAPSSQLIVYYFQLSGEIVYDIVSLDFEILMTNELNLKLSSNSSRPGVNCYIDITTQPHSFVSLLAVDEASTLMARGNDIDTPRIFSDMNFFEHKTLKVENIDQRYQDFTESGLFLITNAIDGNVSCIDPRMDDDYEDIFLEFEDLNDLEETGDEETENANRVRKDFRETWLFDDIQADDEGEFRLITKIPDEITSYIVSGFSLHPQHGLGIATPRKITVFQEFFIKLLLPFSIRFGEVLRIEVTVFNFITRQKGPIEVEVKMFTEGDFEFVEATTVGKTCRVSNLKENFIMKTLKVDAGSGGLTFFLIRATALGEIKLKVKASAEGFEDEVEQFLRVESEGMTHYRNEPKLFDLRNSSFVSFDFELKIPTENVVAKSIHVEASVVGDMMGPALANIQNLIRKPTGCNEQAFNSWIPNSVVLKYLETIKKVTPKQYTAVRNYIEAGNQKLLKFRNPDGSFNLFRSQNKTNYEPNIWLTAYIAKLLAYAKDFYPLNTKVITDALEFLKSTQLPDGSFPQQTTHYEHSLRSTTNVALSAFIAIAFIHNKHHSSQFQDVIDRALNNIDSKLSQLRDNYDIALSAYALALVEPVHPSRDDFIRELQKNAIIQDGKMFWFREVKALTSKDSASVNVEIASYALMAFVKSGLAREAVPIMRWLMSQRTSKGGFYSTIDTVVGIEALTMMASEFYAPKIALNVELLYKNRLENMKITRKNALDLQFVEIDPSVRRIKCNVNGSGLAFVQVAYRYNSIMADLQIRFELNVTVETSTENLLSLNICASYIPDSESSKIGMTLIEVFLPSGFVYDTESSDLLLKAGVRKIETKSRKTIVILYFDSFSDVIICVKIKAIRMQVVTSLKQSAVRIYEYSAAEKNRATAFYLPLMKKPCGF